MILRCSGPDLAIGDRSMATLRGGGGAGGRRRGLGQGCGNNRGGGGGGRGNMALILIVDDEADVRAALRELLEAEGHRMLEATDGDELIRLVMTHWPDLVLLDQLMPKVPGFEALERLRINPAGREFPVIMVTAAGSPQDSIRARKLGALEYIGKPWSKGEVEMRVKWVLQTVKRPQTRTPRSDLRGRR